MNNESKPTSSHKGEKKKSTPLAVGDAAQSNDSVSHRQDMQKSEVSNKVNLPDELRSREKTFQATPHDMHHEREDETTALRREDIISSQLRSVLTDASDDTNSTSIGEKEGCGFLLFDSLSKTSRAKIEKRGQSEDDTKTLSKENIKKAYRENDIDALYKSTKSFMDVAQEENKALKNELDQLKSSFATYRSSSRIELLSEENAQLKKQVKTLMEYIELRESDVQQAMSKMENETNLLLKEVNSRATNVLRQTGTQISRSKMLTAELRQATKKYS